jgi:hypothetical protein
MHSTVNSFLIFRSGLSDIRINCNRIRECLLMMIIIIVIIISLSSSSSLLLLL